MAYQNTVIFQRTDLGRAEIRQKQHGLTQSERLVLIIVDGVSTYAQLRVKLKSLMKERFDRAVRSLSDKGLLYEVMFPLDNQVPDFVEPDAMDRFLRQEDSDPISVIAYQPEEELSDSVLRADGLIPLDEVEEEPIDPYPSLIMNTIDRLEEPVIYTKDKVVKTIKVTPEPETLDVDFYLPLDSVEEPALRHAPVSVPSVIELDPVSATVKSKPTGLSQTQVAPVIQSPEVKVEVTRQARSEVKSVTRPPEEPKRAPDPKSLPTSRPTVRASGDPITQVVPLPDGAVKRTKVIQKFPEPKPPKPATVKRKKTWVDYLDSKYSLILLVLGIALAFVPTVLKLLK